MKTLNRKIRTVSDFYKASRRSTVDLLEANKLLAEAFSTYLNGKLVRSPAGLGTIEAVHGSSFNQLELQVKLAGRTHNIPLRAALLGSTCFVRVYNAELIANYNKACVMLEEFKKLTKVAESVVVTDGAAEELVGISKADLETEHDEEFYYLLGWLAINCNSITAVVSKDKENEFKEIFGNKVPHKVLEDTSKSIAQFKLTFKKQVEIPNGLQSYLSNSGKDITDNDFITELVTKYGFRFGRQQNCDEIKNTVPEQFLAYFDEALIA